jgi:DNA-binding XRE family transcriptional regulator
MKALNLGKREIIAVQRKIGGKRWICLKPTDFRFILKRVKTVPSAPADELEPEIIKETAAVLRDPHLKHYDFKEFLKEVAVEDIKIARKHANMTQASLAKKAGLSQPQLSHIERNPAGASSATLKKIATVLGVRIVIAL